MMPRFFKVIVNKPMPWGSQQSPPFMILRRAPVSAVNPKQWIINPPGLNQLIGEGNDEFPDTPKQHWFNDGSGLLRAMTEVEKAEAYSAELEDVKKSHKVLLTSAILNFIASRYTHSEQLLLNSLSVNSELIESWKEWMTDVALEAAKLLYWVDNAQTIQQVLAIDFDSDKFRQSDPHVTLQDVFNLQSQGRKNKS